MPTPKQIRAARVFLDWSQDDLAQASGLAVSTIRNIEGGANIPGGKSANALERAFAAYIDFLPNGGIQPKQEAVLIYRGRSGFVDFFWDVHATIKEMGGDICVSNVNEKDFSHWFDELEAQKYDEAMASLETKFLCKCLIKEGDYDFYSSKYAEYRWVPKKEFGSVPFYVYGNKMAIVLFGKDVSVYVMDNGEVANAYRSQFKILWDRALVPDKGAKK